MPKRGDPQIKVRLTPAMNAWLEAQAEANHRTKTAEVAYRLDVAKEVAEPAAGQASQA